MMTAVEQNNIEKQKESAADQQTSKKARNRQSDDGPDVLPCMEHFVTLARKVKRPALILTLVERAADTTLPEIAALIEVAKGVLPISARKALFHVVAKLMPDKQQRIERAAGLSRIPRHFGHALFVTIELFEHDHGQKNVVFFEAKQAHWVMQQDVGVQHEQFGWPDML